MADRAPEGGAPAPGEPSPLLAKLEAAHRMVVDLSKGRRDWTMSIPARPDHDPDLIIGAALREAEAFVRAAVLGAAPAPAEPPIGYVVEASGHGSRFRFDYPAKMHLTIDAAETEALQWIGRADTIGGDARVVPVYRRAAAPADDALRSEVEQLRAAFTLVSERLAIQFHLDESELLPEDREPPGPYEYEGKAWWELPESAKAVFRSRVLQDVLASRAPAGGQDGC